MSDTTTNEQQPDLSGLTGSPGHKRKREPDSPNARLKRSAPAATMAADTAAFIENAIEATHAAAVAAHGVNVADFNALQQATAGDHSDTSDPSNATSTAQAALGMYPTLHVPASTEEQFAAQVTAEGEHQQQQQQQQPSQHHHDGAYNPDLAHADMMDPSAMGQQSVDGVPPQGHRYSTSSGTPNSKPSVGSDEWHKMRKDNHKEGKLVPLPFQPPLNSLH